MAKSQAPGKSEQAKKSPDAKSAGGKAAAKQAASKQPASKQPASKGPSAPAIAKQAVAAAGPARLQVHYRDHVVPELMKKFGYTTVMQVPRIRKISLNMGVGEAASDKKILDNALGDMTRLSGQKPVVTKSRKSIAGFKIRAGVPIGCMVTLRGARMYEFLDRLVSIAIPRIRDFRGVSSRAFDGRGNYSLGVKEQIIFPEIEYDKIDALRGMNISIATSAKTDDEAKALLGAFRFPFKH